MKIRSQLPISYEIVESSSLLFPQNKTLVEYGGSTRRFVVIDQGICRFYLSFVKDYFDSVGIEAQIITINAVEDNKNLETLLTVIRGMETFGLLRRNEPVIAIGGGVLLDIVGLACSLYRRGVPYIRVPTTLVGLVDASVGIKTGINFEGRRNRLGTYYPPLVSYLDTSFLRTLAPIEISSGLGEILKIAVIKDKVLFDLLNDYGRELLQSKFNHDYANDVIQHAITGMVEELKDNLWETNLQRLVDFGHSFSPILEMRSLQTSNPLTHGQAVVLDMILSSIIAYERGSIPITDVVSIIDVAARMDLPTIHPLFCEPLFLLEALNDTIKHRDGNQNLPIPTSIGQGAFLNNVSFSEIKTAVDTLRRFNR